MDPPTGVVNKISKMLNAYFWGDDSQPKHIHWKTWDLIFLPYSEGGIGCRSLKDMSMAFDCKLWWKFRKQESLWSWVMKGKYCRLIHANLITTSKTYVLEFRGNSNWKLDKLTSILPPKLVNEIKDIPVSNQADKLFWKLDKSGAFSVSSCAELFRHKSSS
ncbi:Uncharacterized protein Adt_22792 [Abeliophyllum distichum]|uniref:Uncharacterized protein n=1 Tax=Abeliophyllum distichum TaxID=126358 RepID=A0ABD1SC04_9LAMI